ncbi:MAG: NAD(P)-dependent alcohol dehydrogenase [Pseudomonadota bacterium]
MEIQAAVLREVGKPFSIETLTLEEPGPGEVRVKVAATGLCHTDLSVRDGHMPAPMPIVPGHEGAGIVDAVGSGVTKVAPGDSVVMSYLSCGGCPSCMKGVPSYCQQIFRLNFSGGRLDGSSPLSDASGTKVHGMFFGQSSFATYAVAGERNVVKVPAECDLTQLGPLGCGLLTGAGAVFNVLKPDPGSNFVVYGVGGVGLSGIMAAKSLGVSKIVAVDRHPSRLEIARDLGATHTVNGSETDIVPGVQAALGGGADFALETTGVPTVIRAGIDALAIPGSIAVVGVSAPGAEIAVDASTIIFGKRILGVIEGDAVPDILIPHMVDLYQRGQFPLERFTKRYPLDAINQAARDSEAGITIKPVLVP